MMTSNNSPLLKGSQKTKGTIWKPLIAVSSLSIFSFISGQYLPYVIIAVSGSGPIAAVPLAIFAVSAVVALISTIYLIRLAVSRADSKKEAGLDGEESGHIASQEPQKFVCENCTNLENKSNVPTTTPPTVTLGTQPSANAPPPPPPPPPSKRTERPKNGAPKKADGPGTHDNHPALLKQIREGIKLKTIDDGTAQKNTTTEEFTPPEGGEQQDGDFMAELSKKLKSRRKGISGKQKRDVEQKQENNLTGVFRKMSDMIPPPRSSSSSVSSNGSEKSEQDSSDEDTHQLDNKKGTSTPESGYRSDDDETSQGAGVQASSGSPLSKERSGSFDSGHGSDDNVKPKSTPPPHSALKAKPPVPLEPVNLQTKPEAPPATTVTEVKGSSTRSVKGLTEMFNNLGGSPSLLFLK